MKQLKGQDLKQLKQLAYFIYQQTQDMIWFAGKSGKVSDWPRNLPAPPGGSSYSYKKTIWTISPEVVYDNIRMRVCVSGISGEKQHHVRVFANDSVSNPGGMYAAFTNTSEGWFFKNKDLWSSRIIAQEIVEGGKTSHIDKRSLMLKDIDGEKNKPHPEQKHYCIECLSEIK